tara:strand:+ start:258 stop:566 length:309 start_codon:yes stop_codon:yes gene_type:complete
MSTADETFIQKLVRKCTAEPLVPIGALATVGFLGSGLRAFHKGQAATSQTLMRGRVIAQGFTVVVMLAGAAYGLKPLQPGGNRPRTYGEKMQMEAAAKGNQA